MEQSCRSLYNGCIFTQWAIRAGGAFSTRAFGHFCPEPLWEPFWCPEFLWCDLIYLIWPVHKVLLVLSKKCQPLYKIPAPVTTITLRNHPQWSFVDPLFVTFRWLLPFLCSASTTRASCASVTLFLHVSYDDDEKEEEDDAEDEYQDHDHDGYPYSVTSIMMMIMIGVEGLWHKYVGWWSRSVGQIWPRSKFKIRDKKEREKVQVKDLRQKRKRKDPS